MKPTRIPSRMRKNTPDRIVRIPIFYIFASISWAFGSQWCSQERKNPGIIRMSGFLCYLKAAILHTAAMLAHGIAGRSNPMGSVRHTNHQKKKPSGWMVSFLCFHYTIDELPTCRSSLDQLQNQARFCKMFSLPHGSRRRICPKRLLQNRSDTVGRSYSYDILKNCTLERGEQCTICSVVYCKLMEYVV